MHPGLGVVQSSPCTAWHHHDFVGCGVRPLFPPSSPGGGFTPHHSHVPGGSASPFPHPGLAPMGTLTRCSACGLWMSFAVTATVSPLWAWDKMWQPGKGHAAGPREALGMCPQQASIPPQQSGAPCDLQAVQGAGCDPLGSTVPARGLGFIQEGQRDMARKWSNPSPAAGRARVTKPNGARPAERSRTEIQDHLSRCRRMRGCGSTPSRWSLIHRHQQEPCSQSSGGSTTEPKIVLPAVEFKV